MSWRKISACLVVVSLALALRIGWVGYCWVQRGPALEFDDERVHWELASNLTRNGVLATNDGRYAARMPLYPLFLTPFAHLGTGGILAARLAQAVLSTATVAAVWQIAQGVAGRRTAALAGALACLDPFAIFFCNLLLTETFYSLLAVGLVGCAWKLLNRDDWRKAGTGLALLGATALMTRPTTLGWLILLWFSILLTARSRQAWMAVASSIAVLALALLPWGLRNRQQIGAYAWLSTNGGVTLYDGQGPQADGSSNQAFLAQMPELAALDEVQRDRKLRQLALQQMRADPARVVRLGLVKLARTWNPLPNVAAYRRPSVAIVGAAFTVVLAALALAGLWRAIASRSARYLRYQALLWLPVVYFSLVHCVFVGSVRYRVPLLPLLALSAGLTRAQAGAILGGSSSQESQG